MSTKKAAKQARKQAKVALDDDENTRSNLAPTQSTGLRGPAVLEHTFAPRPPPEFVMKDTPPPAIDNPPMLNLDNLSSVLHIETGASIDGRAKILSTAMSWPSRPL